MRSQVPVTTSTFIALRNTHFRLYFIGQLISTSGTWMQNVAQGYLVYQLTGSELWLGLIACAAGIPMMILSPFAGTVIEGFSRRNILIVTQMLQMLLALCWPHWCLRGWYKRGISWCWRCC